MTALSATTLAAASPVVTVLALCYNHARFLQDCLDSIAAQTTQDFQLIIADDCSKDESANMIEAWLTEHRPEAVFIRHTCNVGLCKTLNEALSHVKAEFICMIATDDVWEPNKIERQLALMRQQSTAVAVVYSDASRMDEAGVRLEPDFIQAHTPDCTRPSGNIFAELANRNFIPAMSTLIRYQALLEVGRYDERLSYEDYDMWLRLAARYDFVYCPGLLARYRIVGTSVVRTLFVNPSAQHFYTLYLICQKWLPSGRLNARQRDAWIERLWTSAYGLYVLGDGRARACLWQAAWLSRRPRAFALAVTCSLGISRQMAKRLSRSAE